jgi:mxaL protein
MQHLASWIDRARARGWPVRVALLLAPALIAAALLAPGVPLARRVFDGIVILDITQSMNTLDTVIDGRPTSRLAFVKARLHRALKQLPCGSRVGWGVFTEYRSYVLLTPVEVCANYGDLSATLDRIDVTMAWAGGSEITKGLISALRISARMPERPAIVFLTDGHEAPPLRSDFVPVVPDEARDARGMIVGVGGDALRPIPKVDPDGRPIGLWGPEEVLQSPQVFASDAAYPTRQTAPSGTEHLSSLKENHLRELAALTGLGYVRLTPATRLAEVLQDERATRRMPALADTRMPLAIAALALILFGIGPVRRLPRYRPLSRT